MIRVLTRVFDIDQDVGQKAVQSHLWDIASALVPIGCAGEFNQGMMELGALVCSPIEPRCLACPWKHFCAAYRDGVQQFRPVKVKKTKPKPQELVSVVIKRTDGAVWLTKRPEKGLFGGMWEVPTHEKHPDDDRSPHTVAQAVISHLTDQSAHLVCLADVRHTLTHRQLRVHTFCAHFESPSDLFVGTADGNGRWVADEHGLRSLGIGTLTRKILQRAKVFCDEPKQANLL
ncbi:MAG: NUDIX domain-containing protein [Myxococcales bacterium]|nr:NUDIX domain-containing protein [Myxococcales bacterium]